MGVGHYKIFVFSLVLGRDHRGTESDTISVRNVMGVLGHLRLEWRDYRSRMMRGREETMSVYPEQ